jgi:hypothetical protein
MNKVVWVRLDILGVKQGRDVFVDGKNLAPVRVLYPLKVMDVHKDVHRDVHNVHKEILVHPMLNVHHQINVYAN